MNIEPDLYIQGAGFELPKSMYSFSFPYLKDAKTILNLGCGLNFVFERYLCEISDVKVTSVDMLEPENIPGFVSRFVVKDVEEVFSLKRFFDAVSFFEVIEHIDNTDVLLTNCYNHLKKDGYLIFSFPNLSSIYGRVELLFGYQPHVLEVSNVKGTFGAGIFGKLNTPRGASLHHIRGITSRAMKELVEFHGFEIVSIYGYSKHVPVLFKRFPSLAPVNVFVCRKKEE